MCTCGSRGHGLVVTLALLGLSWTWRSFKPKEFYGSTMHFQLKVVLGIFAFISRVQKKGSFVSTIRILVAICFPSYSHHWKFISPLLSLLQDNTLFTCKHDSFQCQVYELKKKSSEDQSNHHNYWAAHGTCAKISAGSELGVDTRLAFWQMGKAHKSPLPKRWTFQNRRWSMCKTRSLNSSVLSIRHHQATATTFLFKRSEVPRTWNY